MRYSMMMLSAGTLALAALTACQPADDDEPGDGAERQGAPIQESQPGDQVGSNQAPHTAGPETNIDTAGTPPVQAGGASDAESLDEEQTARYISDEYSIQVAFHRDLTVVNSQAGRVESGADTDQGEGATDDGTTDDGSDDRTRQASGDDQAWKMFAGEDAEGIRLLTLAAPGHDQAVRFMLGVSRSTQALSHCKDAPADAADDTETSRTIDGIPFRRFEITNTDEQGYRTVQSYRATYGEACFAIDLVARGSGEGGDAEEQALEQLQAVLAGIEFTE